MPYVSKPAVVLNSDGAPCTDAHNLVTKRFSTDMCQKLGVMAEGEDRTAVVWMIGVIFGAIGIAAFFLRILARLHVGAQAWGLDDWFMCLAVVCLRYPCLSRPLGHLRRLCLAD